MPAILIDYEKIVSEKHSNLLQKLPLPPKTAKGFMVGLVIITSSSEIRKLPTGDSRVSYINNPQFVNSIIDFSYVMYNKNKGVCLLNPDSANHIQDILNALFSGLDQKTSLWVSVVLQEANFMSTVKKFAQAGFNSPYMTNMSPLMVNISPSIALVRQNTPTEKYNVSTTLNKVLYAIKQYKEGGKSCSLYAQLSPRALSFLRKASKIGITMNDNGEKSQKELTGELFVNNVRKKGNKFVYIIDIDEGSVESGAEEDVDVAATRYNFHSHPHEAYVRHSVDKAWPSLTDYLGFLQLGINTIFHCVATLEGIYVMSFGPIWGNNLKKVSKNFIKKNYDIDHKDPYTPQQYVDKVNKIKYKDHPIYNVQFFTWKNASEVFRVSYAKIGMSCITTEKGSQVYKKIHNK